MYSEEIFFIYCNSSRNTMGIGTSLGLTRPEYAIGQELFNFIDLDLEEYEKRRNMLYNYFFHRKSAKIEQEIISLYEQNSAFKKRHRKAKTIKQLVEHGELAEFLLKTSEAIANHPYCFFCIAEERDILEEHGLDLLFYQKRINELINFCFDQEYNPLLNELTAEERYFLWRKRNLNQIFTVEQSEINCRTNIVFLSSREFSDSEKEHLYSDEISTQTIDLIKSTNVFPLHLYYCANPVEYALCEFNSLIQINAKMKRCKRCGKYFLLKGDYNTDYCDRILPGEKLTCKKAAAIDTRKRKIQKSPILKEYERAYKRNYARLSNHKMTNEDFRLWTEKASKKRDELAAQYELTHSQDLVTEFIDYLGNKKSSDV